MKTHGKKSHWTCIWKYKCGEQQWDEFGSTNKRPIRQDWEEKTNKKRAAKLYIIKREKITRKTAQTNCLIIILNAYKFWSNF